MCLWGIGVEVCWVKVERSTLAKALSKETWMKVPRLGMQIWIWVCLAVPGIGNWVLGCSSFQKTAVHWLGTTSDVGRADFFNEIWETKLYYHTQDFVPEPDTSLTHYLPSALEHWGLCCASAFAPFRECLCLEFYSIWLKSIIPFNAPTIF